MVTLSDAILTSATWLTLLAFVIAFFTMRASTKLDEYRQGLFAIRDALFDLAADGYLRFDHPAYVLLRTTINGHIRHAHFVGVLPLLAVSLANRRKPERPHSDRIEDAIADLPHETQARIRKIERQMQQLVVPYVIPLSPVALAIFRRSFQPYRKAIIRDRVVLSRPIEESNYLAEHWRGSRGIGIHG
jgi:hypothetical protein